MIRKVINRLLLQDIQADQPERQRLAQLVYRYLLGIAIVVGSMATLLTLMGEMTERHATIMLLAAPVMVLLAWIVRRGRIEVGVWLFIVLGSLTATSISVSSNGIHNPIIAPAFMVLILIAGTLLSHRAAVVVAVAAILIELGIALAQMNGRLPGSSIPGTSTFSIWIHHTFQFTGAAFLLSLAATTVRGALRRAQRELEERRNLEVLYRRAISAAEAVPYSLDYRTNEYTFIGDGIQKLTGYSAGEFTGTLFRSLIEKVEMRSDTATPNPQMAGIMATNAVNNAATNAAISVATNVATNGATDMADDGQIVEWKSDYRIHARSGEQRWLTDAAVQLFEGESHPTGAIGLLFDITERKRAEAALSESERRWRTIFDRSATGIALSNLGGDILESNPAFQRMLGYSGEDLRHMRFSELTHPEDLPDELAGVETLLNGKENYFQMEKRYVRKDGSLLWSWMTAALIPDETGAPRLGLSIIDDITERKNAEKVLRQLNSELEQRVKLRTAEMEAANRELESFSYSVSHDLRAPLRAIDGYGNILELDFSDRLEDDGLVLLRNIRLATQKMSQLIDDLLKLSRVSRAEMTISRVNLSAIAGQLLRLLAEQEPAGQVEIQVEAELWVQGDASLLQVALDNLLRNAWKFTGKTPEACIQVGALKEARPTIYFVSDNGAGFAMRYAEKLFIPFQRLHSAEEFEGTGVGLATVQRVIQRHGGRVWAEGAPGRGATFYFTLG